METAKFISFVFFAAFAGVVPPGLVNIAVAKIALEKDKRNGVFAAIGAGLMIFIYAFIAILAARYILRHTNIQMNMLKTGAIVFALLTVYFLVVALKNKARPPKKVKESSHRSFAKGFLIAGLNILPIPYFVFISTQLNSGVIDPYSWTFVFLFALSAGAGTFAILYIYIWVFVKIEKHTEVISRYANYFMAVLMFVLFIITLIRMYHVV